MNFYLKKALAGEPVILEDGTKAYIKYVIPEEYQTEYPLRGYYVNKWGHICDMSWTSDGIYNLRVDSNKDIIGMWVKPRPTVTLTLPCPLKEPQEDMWFIHEGEVLQSMHTSNDTFDTFFRDVIFKKNFYFATKEDAEAWLNALTDNRT